MQNCPECGSKDFNKNGKKGELQRYKCKNLECGSSFSFGKKSKISNESKALAIWLYECGEQYVTKRELSAIIGCAVGSVYRWKKERKKIFLKIKNEIALAASLKKLIEKSGLEFSKQRIEAILVKVANSFNSTTY